MKMDRLEVVYENDKKLSICDFIEEIKEDLRQRLSKNRQDFLDTWDYGVDEPNEIIFEVGYSDGDFFHLICFTAKRGLGVNEICVKKFVKKIFKAANRSFPDNICQYDYSPSGDWCISNWDDFNYFYDEDGVYLGYYDHECRIDTFDKKFLIEKLSVFLRLNEYRIAYKETIYMDFYNELMVVTWHPDRVMDWCRDIEEQAIYNSLPDE